MRVACLRSFVVLVNVVAIGCGDDGGGAVDATPVDTADPRFTLNVARDGAGVGTVTSSPAGIDCGVDCSEALPAGTSVTLTATPDGASDFTGWSGGGCSGTDPCTVSLTADTSVTATFVAKQTLTVTVAGTGTVVSNPGGIDCGSDCSEAFAADTVVTLTPAPDASSHFVGFSGACTGMTCSVTMDASKAVTATFETNRYALTTMVGGSGAGSVSSLPAGIDCGADCTEDYDHGTMVTLTATPAVGSVFAGWSGGSCTGTGTCVVTLTAATAVTANFMITQENVTVMKGGNGSGTVSSMPAGIDCGTDCSEAYNYGTMVTLTATPATGSVFSGWSGACSGTGTCTVGVTQATAVMATFTLTQHVLTVTRSGTGTGTVTSVPAGINCGADCSEPVDYNTLVTLTAAPTSGTTFVGWTGGGCSGTGTCQVTMTAATTVNAAFTLNTYALTVTRVGNGAGTVTSSPAGINCGADCMQSYNHGTVVALTATPGANSTFVGWGGACTGTGACQVTMTTTRDVSATFAAACTGSATFQHTGALQQFTVPACATSVTIEAHGAEGGTSTGESGGQSVIGGHGAMQRGTFAVSGGQVLDVLVGGRGVDNRCGSGGGGGSFVVRGGAALLIAGGGGGGFHCNVLGAVAGVAGSLTTSGGAGVCTQNPNYVRNPTPGGTNGNGASCGYGGGGGGLLTDGVSQYLMGAGGRKYPGDGGVPGGGFGGGGGYHNTCCGGSGGGGGYSGGGGSQSDGCAGGGGGSLNTGTSPTAQVSTRTGNGLVVISW